MCLSRDVQRAGTTRPRRARVGAGLYRTLQSLPRCLFAAAPIVCGVMGRGGDVSGVRLSGLKSGCDAVLNSRRLAVINSRCHAVLPLASRAFNFRHWSACALESTDGGCAYVWYVCFSRQFRGRWREPERLLRQVQSPARRFCDPRLECVPAHGTDSGECGGRIRVVRGLLVCARAYGAALELFAPLRPPHHSDNVSACWWQCARV